MSLADGETETWVYCRNAQQHRVWVSPEPSTPGQRLTRIYAISDSPWYWGKPQPNGTVQVFRNADGVVTDTVSETTCPAPLNDQDYSQGICGAGLFKAGTQSAAQSAARWQ